MAENYCGTCRFWDREREDDDVGRCRRFPPMNTKMPGRLEQFGGGVFPVTYERQDWCGEHQALPLKADGES